MGLAYSPQPWELTVGPGQDPLACPPNMVAFTAELSRIATFDR